MIGVCGVSYSSVKNIAGVLSFVVKRD